MCAVGEFFVLVADFAEIVGVAILNNGHGPKIFAHTLCALLICPTSVSYTVGNYICSR